MAFAFNKQRRQEISAAQVIPRERRHTRLAPEGENVIDQRNSNLNGSFAYPAWKIFFKQNHDDNIRQITELASAGVNMIRQVMFTAHYAFMTEDINAYDAYFVNADCPEIPINENYYGNRQYWTRKLDEIFDFCYDNNMYVQLNSLISFPQTWGDWGNFSHNMFFRKFVTNFGQNDPGPYPIEHFFKNSGLLIPNTTTEEVEYYWKRYFKYLMSRWGYSINLGILEPMGEVDQTLGYVERNYTGQIEDPGHPGQYIYEWGNGDLCENHRAKYEEPGCSYIRDAIDDWYTMIGHYIRDVSADGLNDRHIPLTVSYTDYALYKYGADWTAIRDHCRHFYNDQIDLIEFHRYSDDKNAFNYNFNLSKDIYDPAKYNYSGNPQNPMPLSAKPFACGELATMGSIDIIQSNGPPITTKSVSTAPYYNNYDISHHNEIWGSAFIGNFHSGLTWLVDASHKWPGANPMLPDFNPPLELGDNFILKDNSGVAIGSGTIEPTYPNFTPFNDFLNAVNIDFNDSWIPYAFYDDVQGVECYSISNSSEDKAYGWIHNINFYWENNYYYGTVTLPSQQNTYYNFTGCNPPNYTTGIEIGGLTPGYLYDMQFYYTRIGTPPLDFPPGVTTTAGLDGKITVDASILGTYLGCEKDRADVAFKLTRFPNRPGSNEKTEANPEIINNDFNFSIFPNPGNGIFNLQIKCKDQINIEPVSIKVYDLSGRLLVKNENILSNSYTINLSFLAKGCYFITISQNKQEHFSKIIIQ